MVERLELDDEALADLMVNIPPQNLLTPEPTRVDARRSFSFFFFLFTNNHRLLHVSFRKALVDDAGSSERPELRRSAFDIAFFSLIVKLHGERELPAWLRLQASGNSIPQELPSSANRRYPQIYKVRLCFIFVYAVFMFHVS